MGDKARRPDYRHCQTHAMVAQMFAANTRDYESRATWEYVAAAWTDLAKIKRFEAERSYEPAPPEP